MTLDECDGDDGIEKMKEVFNGWVAMEDNDFCQEIVRDEIDSLLEIEVLSGLKDVPDGNDDEEADDDNMDIEDVVQAKPITLKTLHELTVKLKSLAVEIGELEGDEFRSVSSVVFDAAESLRSAFRKVENSKLAYKRDNRQASTLPFMKK